MIETYSFGAWVSQRRKSLDLSQRELASQTNCALITIKKIELDERRPSRELALLLADVLRIPSVLRDTFIECARGLRPVDALRAVSSADSNAPQPKSTAILNLPALPTTFIGREAELAQIGDFLRQADCRLLTLIGQGGIGKTRLAIEAARTHGSMFPDGMVFVPLAAVTDAALIPTSIATSMQLPPSDNPQAHLLGHLRSKHQLLLLDNCEQLGDGVMWLSEFLAAARGIKLLVTSRERLRLAEEWVYRVPELDDTHAIALFEEAAQRTGHHLPKQEQDVTTVCRLVENSPLAIELAASWTPLLSCAEIAKHIQQDIDFLAAHTRNVSERHRSLRAVFDHSWKLLSPDEQHVFMKLSVFRGGWNIQTAESIAGATLPILRAVVEKSLIRSVGDDRYDLHELTRQYAADKLHEANLEQELQRQHAITFLNLAEDLVLRSRTGGSETEIAARRRTSQNEEDNLRTALDWTLKSGEAELAARLVSALFFYWLGKGYLKEGLRRTDQVVTAFPNMPPRLKARTLSILAILLNRNGVYQRAGDVVQEAIPLAEAVGDKETLAHLWQELSFKTTDYEMATDYLEKSLELHREMQNLWAVALILQLLGDRARIYGDLDRADSLYSESIAILRQTNFTTRIAYPRGNQGRIAFERGDYAQARAIFEESIALCRKANAIAGIADWSFQLALVTLVQGDYEQARAAIHETLTLCFQLGNLSEITDCLVLSAGLALALGQFERAAKLLGASEIALEQYHNILEPSTRTRYDTYAHETRAQLSETAFESHFHAGRILSIEQAINYAMEVL